MEKLRIGLVFGGRSVEHEVSIASATSILQALDPERYEVMLIEVDHSGRWHLGGRTLPPRSTDRGAEVTIPIAPGSSTLVPASDDSSVVDGPADPGGPSPIPRDASSPTDRNASFPIHLDVLFPIIHGHGGEDGKLQGLLELAEIPYVGSGVLGSAIQMDKDVSKQLLAHAGLPVVPWRTLIAGRPDGEKAARAAIEALGLPVFVKPANSGSSVGIAKASSWQELEEAIADAARYDTKILIEQAIDAREVEVAVIGNHTAETSVPGEIRSSAEFYDYEAKYVDDSTELLVPAPISEELTQRARTLAAEAFEILCARGLARVDFLLDRATEALYINEVNSLPGFTEGSMFPLLWQASGLSYAALLDRLIELAQESHAERASLETIYRRS